MNRHDLSLLLHAFTSTVIVALLCSMPTPARAQAPAYPSVAASAAFRAPYRIARGDELNLKFFYTPELNTIATVRSDGRIAVPLVGEIFVEGLSPADLSALIVTRLAGEVKRPEVAINVQGVSSQRIFIGGEVGRPGVQPLVGPLSLAQAVMAAEGLRDTARSSEVVVIRRGLQGERTIVKVNLEAVLEGRDPAQDLTLQAYDVVVVPKSGVANLNVWVDQYLRRNLPLNLGISYSLNHGTVYP